MFYSILELTKQLIMRPSVSPYDAGCQDIIMSRLQILDFTIERMPFNNTLNFWAWRGGHGGRTLAFAGHTDVVPPGNLQHWDNPPFKPTLCNGILYGRGSADMKGSLAAMVIAVERFITKYPQHNGRLAFLITSDEEDNAQNGTKKVVDKLIEREERIDYCLIGEPSSNKKIGDVIKNGRRGSLTANLIVYGIQGHVAYPNLAENPIHNAIAALKELIKIKFSKDNNTSSPPTTIQITNIHAGTGTNNIIPDVLQVQFNFRFNTELTENIIRRDVEKILQYHKLRFRINWLLSSNPFLSPHKELIDVTIQAVEHYQGITPIVETSGGTSDGRFIAFLNSQIVELGPVNTTIHGVNECVRISDLQLLSKMYQYIITKLIA